MKYRFLLAGIFSGCAAATASSHPADAPFADLASGFLHPIGGLDHLLAMVAVGLWASRLGGRAVLALPLCFVLVMLAAAFGGGHAGASEALDLMVASTVTALGVLIAGGIRFGLGISAPLVALFAVVHGIAHGADLAGTSAVASALGFGTATAALHAIGIGFGLALARRSAAPRLAGAALIAAGASLVMLAS